MSWIKLVKQRQFRLLVCGGRTFDEKSWMFTRLAEALSVCQDLHVIHGGAKGADECAGVVCEELAIPYTVYPADWQKHGKSAGHIRNELMLMQGKPHVVMPFPGGKGTGHMVMLAHKAGVPLVDVNAVVDVGALYF